MKLNTCSGAISLAKELENESAKFYESLSQKYARDAEVFLAFARENRKNAMNVERAYFGVISDAIEGCFAFDLDPDQYRIDTNLADRIGYPDAVKKAIEIEKKIIRFYNDGAAQSEGLMADVPRAFKAVAKKRETRLPKLEALLANK